jgi:hypothetical protein
LLFRADDFTYLGAVPYSAVSYRLRATSAGKTGVELPALTEGHLVFEAENALCRAEAGKSEFAE